MSPPMEGLVSIVTPTKGPLLEMSPPQPPNSAFSLMEFLSSQVLKFFLGTGPFFYEIFYGRADGSPL